MTHARSHRPSALFESLIARVEGRRVSVGQIARHLGGDGALGMSLMLLAILVIVPSPSLPLGLIFGTAMALISLQIVAGSRALRLPRWLARRRLDADHVRSLTTRAVPLLKRFDRLLKPRMTALTRPWVVRLLGLVVLVHGVLIALLIPFGNTLPGLAVLALALGLTARDGAAVAAGLGLSVVAVAASVFLVVSTLWLGDAVLRA